MNTRNCKFAIVFTLGLMSAAAAQQLKPTEIIYSRTVTNMNAAPTGTNQPTIWAVGQDGSNDRFITNGTMPRISDDGRFLLFKSFTRAPSFYDPFGGYADFVVRELATGQETVIQRMTFNNDQLGYSFSPESNQGSYEIIFDRNCFMFKMDRDGANPFQFPWDNSNFCYDDFPVVRRGDQLIAFSSFTAFPADVGGLYTVTITGTNRQRIPNTTCRDIHPAWSNDNQFIAFGTLFSNCGSNLPSLSYYPYFVSNLVVIKPDGTLRQPLSNFPANPDCSQSNANCLTFGSAWTQDNSKVIAAGRINGTKGLFAFNSNGSGSFTPIPVSPGNAPDFVGGIVQPRVERQVLSFGGGVTTGGDYTLVSTIGEPIAGQTSTGGSYTLESGFWAMPFETRRSLYDYDGDGRTDISVFRPANGAWYLNQSQAGFFGMQFGFGTDKIAPADYDGDGKSDIAVYRPSEGQWYLVNSSNGVVEYRVFGLAEDLPAPADYDGDGKADICVFRPSTGTWYRQNSSNGSFFGIQFGSNGDRPTVGDFDGDGKADIGIWRPSNGDWYHIRSSNASIFGERFGISTDKMVPADYDGDGKTDIAVWRPSSGIWYIKHSSDSSYVSFVFGLPTDIPAPGDFDGDGKADRAVFRPSDGTWYITNSTNGSFTIFPWGQNGDRPTPGAFLD